MWEIEGHPLYRVKTDGAGTVNFKCPECGGRHTHSRPERLGVAEHRAAHCYHGRHKRQGYYIVEIAEEQNGTET